MTPEQLDEIEKLAEAATPGPWVWRGPSSDDPADLWTADGKDAIVCVQTTNVDVKFIRAMREHALPLVKALREALARCETLRDLADEKAHAAGLFARRMEQAQQARHEAALKCAALEAECYQALCDWKEQQDKIESLQHELNASNDTIDMLYQRTGRFSAQADRYEQALQLIANRDCRVGCKERRVVQCATCLAKHTLGLL